MFSFLSMTIIVSVWFVGMLMAQIWIDNYSYNCARNKLIKLTLTISQALIKIFIYVRYPSIKDTIEYIEEFGKLNNVFGHFFLILFSISQISITTTPYLR